MGENVGINSSLSEIIDEYSNVFLDTNIFLNANLYLSKDKRENTLKYFQVMEELSDFWIPALKENTSVYLTKNVFGELRRDHFNYKKELKKHRSFSKDFTEVIRIKKRLKNKRNSILDDFSPSRIVDINNLEDKSIELYNELRERYKHFIQPSKHMESIGEVDFDLLLTSSIFSRTKGNTCLISNDFNLLKRYKFFLSCEGEKRNQFGFYMQRGINFFTRM